MTWFLKVDDVTVKYEDFVALDSVSIEISKGDFIGLLGSNGAGKSTFINTIVGLQPMYRGSVEYNETELSNKQQPFSNIGFNPQTAVMDFYTTVKDNVILGLNLAGIFGSKADELCMQALDVLNLSDKKDKLVDSLSGGQLQRVQLARAIAHKPDFYILDEPTVGLDTESSDRFLSYLKDESNKGKTIIISSHDINLIERFCEKILFLKNKQISYWGTLEDFVNRTNRKVVFSLDHPLTNEQSEFLTSYKENVVIYNNTECMISVDKDDNVIAVINDLGEVLSIKGISIEREYLRDRYLEVVRDSYESK